MFALVGSTRPGRGKATAQELLGLDDEQPVVFMDDIWHEYLGTPNTELIGYFAGLRDRETLGADEEEVVASTSARPRTLMVTEVAPQVHVLGSLRFNWYVVAEGGAFTVVDAGLPVHWPQVGALLTALGASLEDIEAVLVTHAHGDHAGNAERLRTRAAASVYAHAQDWGVMRTGQDPMPGLAKMLTQLFDMRRPELLSFMAEAVRGGGLPMFPAVLELSELVDGEVLDVPGRPRVVHVPGHTPGSCALHLADASAVFTGDALITYHVAAPAWRRRGPQLVKDSWQDDPGQADASLDRLAELDARTVLPGHGEPWHGGIDAAVDHARNLGRV